MATNYDYEGDLEIYPDGHGHKFTVGFRVNWDLIPEQLQTRDDPGFRAEAFVNAVEVTIAGEKVECPKWLEQLILDAVDEDTLLQSVADEVW